MEEEQYVFAKIIVQGPFVFPMQLIACNKTFVNDCRAICYSQTCSSISYTRHSAAAPGLFAQYCYCSRKSAFAHSLESRRFVVLAGWDREQPCLQGPREQSVQLMCNGLGHWIMM